MVLLAPIGGTISYIHMRMIAVRHGQPGWVAALTHLSVDSMIVAASTTPLADSQSGRGWGASAALARSASGGMVACCAVTM